MTPPVRQATGTVVAACALFALVAPSLGHAAAMAPTRGCMTGQLRFTTVPDDGGLGHQSEGILFRNEGGPCTLVGYPTVRLLDRSGHVVAIPRRTPRGYQAGLGGGSAPLVHLGRGRVANIRVEGLTGPADGRPCRRYVTYEVTPPGAARSVLIPAHASLCSPEVHPVVPGTDAVYPHQPKGE